MKFLFIESLVIALIVIAGFVCRMKTKRWCKWLLSALVFFISMRFLFIFVVCGEQIVSSAVPGFLVPLGGWCFAVVVVLAVEIVLWSVVRYSGQFVCCLLKRNCPAVWKNSGLVPMLVIAVLVSTAGIYYGTKMPDVHEITIAIDGLPANAENFRIVLATDLHTDNFADQNFIEKITDRINSLSPDMIALTGDFSDGNIQESAARLQPLKNLRAKYGVFAVPGNHEYFFSDFQYWRDIFQNLNITLLENNAAELPDTGLAVAGISDRAAKTHHALPPDVSAAISVANPEKNKVILLSHRPDRELIQDAADAGAVLQLSGHTHGGMILGFDRIVALSNGGYVRGSYRTGGLTIYVSPGTGIWHGFPFRLGIPAEITLIRLVSAGK